MVSCPPVDGADEGLLYEVPMSQSWSRIRTFLSEKRAPGLRAPSVRPHG